MEKKMMISESPRTSRRIKKRKLANVCVESYKERKSREERVSPLVEKYWFQRYHLFSRYDEGIKMDEEGWYSVTPEEIAIRHAQRSGNGIVIDCFAGVGGNAIQFARMCYSVVAIDIDPQKIEFAINNAKIYGVEDYIDFIVGDFFKLAPSLKGDMVFLAPPWGGPSYKSIEKFTLDSLEPRDGSVLEGEAKVWFHLLAAVYLHDQKKGKKTAFLFTIFQVAQAITTNIIMFLPRNVDLQQVEELSWLSSPPLEVEIEENYVLHNVKGVTAYFSGAACG
ncbi:trimethylguanosine synthase-like isoform X2 [Juglans regia]|uniref:Trimethylguanosine synthase n=1 Tax=Juglans regia TaxID=51240 RepID=A0A6P9EJZ0_JUGRE|nr:trimethylguanosine synthase-like isoform X2 [Juglans regia]